MQGKELLPTCYAEALELMPMPLVVANSAGKLRLANRLALELFGLPENELQRLHFSQIVQVPQEKGINDDRREVRVLSPSSTHLPATLSTRQAILNGEAVTIVTFRKLSPIVKESRESRFIKLLTTSCQDFFITCTADFQFMEVSPQVYESLGYSQAEFLQLPFPNLRTFILDDDKGEYDSVIKKLKDDRPDYVFDGRLAVVQCSVRFVAKTGAIIPMEATLSYKIRSFSQPRNYYICAVRALADRFATEKLEFEQSLKPVRCKSIGAQKLIKFVLQMMESPIEKTLAVTDAFSRESHPTPELSSSLRNMILCIRQMQLVSFDLSQFISLQTESTSPRAANVFTCKEEAFSLRTTISSCLSTYSKQATEKQLELLCSISPELPEQLIGDHIRLVQILSNLVANAIKFTSKGEVRVRVGLLKQEQKKIILRFEVSDTGSGMEQDSLKKLFQPFKQLMEGAQVSKMGSGLGLSIAKFIVEKMGGTIVVKSTLGKGSNFSVEIPFRNA